LSNRFRRSKTIMPWIVGIDEAGYGPNLGPLVMSSVACRVPGELEGTCLWKVLRKAVRRHPSADNGRLLIEDSKVVYSTSQGLAGLETGVLATTRSWPADETLTISRFLDWLCPSHHADLKAEHWYSGESTLPLVAELDGLTTAASRFSDTCAAKDVSFGLVRSVVVCPERFNAILDRWGSKGAVLGQGLADLLSGNLAAFDDEEPVTVVVDKHGGRNTYTAILQNALPDGFVMAQEERMERSIYNVLGLTRPLTVRIQPRADAEHFCVALASMVSKYVRELLMRDFNQFWQLQMPGLEPTAGYPGDAARFYEAIRPAVTRLGIPEPALWRKK